MRATGIAASGLMLALSATAFADPQITIVAEIRPPDAQAGEKLRQVLQVDSKNKIVTAKVMTGTTELLGATLTSARNGTTSSANFSGNVVTITAIGQTASGVYIVPDIDYKLEIKIDLIQRKGIVSGCHDGYPSYTIRVGSTVVYDFKQTSITALAGSCDTNVSPAAEFSY